MGVDTRPITRRAMCFVSLLMALTASGLVFREEGTWGTGVRIGILVSLGCVVGMWAVSLRFEGQHLAEPAEFWISHEAKIRPRAFRTSASVLVLSVLAIVAATTMNRAFLEGFFVGPAATCFFIVGVMWGKVP